jgi:hypothetical protein
MEITILKVGVTSKGQNWALITKTVQGFILQAFVKTAEPLVEGEVLAIPAEIAKAIEWKA